MNKSNVDITSVVKLTTSLLEVLKNQKPHSHFTQAEKKIFQEFFEITDGSGASNPGTPNGAADSGGAPSPNADPSNPIIDLYFQAVSQLNKTPNPSVPTPPDGTSGPDENAEEKQFVQNMNAIFEVFSVRRTNEELGQYKAEIDKMIECYDRHMVGIFQSDLISRLSPAGIKTVQDLMYTWSQFDVAMLHKVEFVSFVNTMGKAGHPLEKRTKDSLCRTFVGLYADMARTFGQKYFAADYSSELSAGVLAFEQFWLDTYLKSKLDKADLANLWNDDSANYILQMLNQKVISPKRNKDLHKDIQEKKEAFLTQEFHLGDVDAAFQIMEDVVKSYKSIPIKDDIVMEEFAKAYRTVYMYELLTGQQKPTDTSRNSKLKNFSQFALMQADALMRYSGKEFSPEVLLKRAIQDLNIKESSRQFDRVFDERIKNSVLTVFEPSSKYSFGRLGHSYAPAQLITMKTPERIPKSKAKDQKGPLAKELIITAHHEQSHVLSGNRIFSGFGTDFGAYTLYQTLKVMELDKTVRVPPNADYYEEIKAETAGIIGFIRALKKYPVGRNSKEKDKEVGILTLEAIKSMGKLIQSPLIKYNGTKWERVNSLSVYDFTFGKYIANKTRRGEELTGYDKLLLFEYDRNGMPKSLETIMAEQQDELNRTSRFSSSMLKYQFGPLTKMDRIKYRMRIMMRRAIATHQEEECISLIEEFLSQEVNKWLFDNDKNFFKNNFPGLKFPSSTEAITSIRELTENATDYGYEDAEFMAVVSIVAKNREKAMADKNKTSQPGARPAPPDGQDDPVQ